MAALSQAVELTVLQHTLSTVILVHPHQPPTSGYERGSSLLLEEYVVKVRLIVGTSDKMLKNHHWQAVERVMRYLCRMPETAADPVICAHTRRLHTH